MGRRKKKGGGRGEGEERGERGRKRGKKGLSEEKKGENERRKKKRVRRRNETKGEEGVKGKRMEGRREGG